MLNLLTSQLKSLKNVRGGELALGKHKKQNYLDLIPLINSDLTWAKNQSGIVVVDVKHNGIYDKIAQKLFHTSKVSHISLDKYGSFIWLLINGERSIYYIGKEVERQFGKDAQPLYERLVKFIAILKNNNFIKFERKNRK